MKTAWVLLAPGFEEIEAVTIVDVLRRAGVEVTVAGIDAEPAVTGAHDIAIAVDHGLSDSASKLPDLLVLPGGMPGSENLAGNPAVLETVRRTLRAGMLVGAICAAPIALQQAGVLAGVRVTAYPSFADRLTGAHYTGKRVERDGRIVTGKGPGAAIDFALELVTALGMKQKALELRRVMMA